MGELTSVLVGDGSLLVQCAEILKARGHKIQTIVTSSEPVRRWAGVAQIPVVSLHSDYASSLADISYDWLFSIANLTIIPQPVWQRARCGAANFHDGLLPQMAGLNTPAWAILEGHDHHGVTWHAINEGIDEGDIYAQQGFDISDDDTALTVNTKCFEAGIATFSTMLDDIEQNALTPRRQDFGTRVYYERLKRPAAAATLDFSQPAKTLSRLVRSLDFGSGYLNPLATPKVRLGGQVFTVAHFRVLEAEMNGEPGLVMSVGAHGVTIGTADAPVLLEAFRKDAAGKVALSSVLRPGDRLPILGEREMTALSETTAELSRHEIFFRRSLETCIDLSLPQVKAPEQAPDIRSKSLSLPAELARRERTALLLSFLARFSGQTGFDVAYTNDGLVNLSKRHPGYFASSVPLHVDTAGHQTTDDLASALDRKLTEIGKRKGYSSDLPDRYPGIATPDLTIGIVDTSDLSQAGGIAGCALTFRLAENGTDLHYDRTRIDDRQVEDLVKALHVLAAAFKTGAVLQDLPLLSDADANVILYDWNATEREYETTACVHELIERQVERTPGAEAIAFRGSTLTYREMDERANRIAQALIAQGVGPDVSVGLYLPRSVDLVVGALAIMKAGGAYIPLDPHFPADRLAFMIADSGAKLVLTERSLAKSPILAGANFLCIDDILRSNASVERPRSGVASNNLAYVIYTSGSTGLPKGVMIEHRNVVNFFAGMDERVPRETDRRNVWLAVTSLSFDISVLELFWTLARGFKVVIHSSEVIEAKAGGGRTVPGRTTNLDFGLFYWGNDGGAGPEKYRLLLEGAKFADANGFDSVWTPERHFHAFGGPYPNPAVTGAAVAAVTKNLSIRAGSCVLPLHHPVRVAEEWAIIDNLSNGRVALAFASGWMPEDFVLRPENAPPKNKASLVRDIETVRKLWRGDKVDFDFGGGTVAVVTQPRPVQKELPVWLTTAGNPETYREAARLGANVLTHLLGQSIEELADKIRIYRETLVEVGRNPSDHKVTLMLHTLLGNEREEVRELARGPMKDYLRSAAALIKQYAWAFPAFKKPQGVAQPMDIDLQSLAPDEMDAILEFAFLRYFEDSGLFGTVEDAIERLAEVNAIGVDEIACLIDFGLPDDVVLGRLPLLAEVVKASKNPASDDPIESFAEAIRKHRVTHLQCTPSMARMFMMVDEDRAALSDVRHVFLGGEALQGSLLAALRTVTDATIENMYGPTETTIWSSTYTAGPSMGVVPIGRPIANTQLYVLDSTLKPVPPGDIGELYIGGDGVARGYLNREQLTNERFLQNPFAEGRIYRTGDLARFDRDGVLHFLGRTDHQVKIRGHRIELGEIEARIATFAGIREAVVVARKDTPGDVRLVAYIRTEGTQVSEQDLRAHVAEALPDVMIPSHFVMMETFPLTPNAKVDRNKLPLPTEKVSSPAVTFIEPSNNLQREISEVFGRALGMEKVGIFDNFFALGGHSLLAVQVHREMKVKFAPDLTITDLFRFPTVALLAEHISGKGKAESQLSRVSERAALRRSLIDRRLTLVGADTKV